MSPTADAQWSGSLNGSTRGVHHVREYHSRISFAVPSPLTKGPRRSDLRTDHWLTTTVPAKRMAMCSRVMLSNCPSLAIGDVTRRTRPVGTPALPRLREASACCHDQRCAMHIRKLLPRGGSCFKG